MLEEVVIIVWVEERLYSIWTVDFSVGNNTIQYNTFIRTISTIYLQGI